MTFAISADLVGDLQNPSLDAIEWAIKQHQSEMKRLEKLHKYYIGEHTFTPNKSRKVETVVNHAKYITDLNVGFTVGTPISYTAEKDVKGLENLLDRFRDIDIITHDTELEKALSVFGIAYELHFMNAETKPDIKAIDPRNAFVVTDDTVNETPLFGVYYWQEQTLNGTNGDYRVNVYTSEKVIEYRTPAIDSLSALKVTGTETPHYFGAVPLVEFINNQEAQGDFEQVISIIDNYNLLQSDRMSDKEKFINAILGVFGTTLVDEEGKTLTEIPDMIELPGEGARLEYIVNTFDETKVQTFVDSTADDIHKISFTPNLNDDKFGGNVSGEAMKWKVFGLLQQLATKQRYLQKGIKQRLKLMENIFKLLNLPAENFVRAKIVFKPNLPVNLSEVIKNISDSQSFYPLALSLGWLPDVDNPEEVIKLLDEQKQKNADAQQQALGSQVQDVNNDSEVAADDEAGQETD